MPPYTRTELILTANYPFSMFLSIPPVSFPSEWPNQERCQVPGQNVRHPHRTFHSAWLFRLWKINPDWPAPYGLHSYQNYRTAYHLPVYFQGTSAAWHPDYNKLPYSHIRTAPESVQ